MSISINVPKEWKKIDENNYKQYGIVNTEENKCIGSYVIKEDDQAVVINFYDYSKYNEKFIKQLHKYYDELNELNELIDGNPEDEDYDDTSVMSSLYHGFINNGKYYLNVGKVLVDTGYSYDIQMFKNGRNGIFAFEVSIKKIDGEDIVKSVISLPYIKEAISALDNISGK